MKITFLGTNGWYDTETGNTPCILIETDDKFIVLDAGFGFYKLKNIINSRKPVSLFLSHLHYDHIIGLHTLPIFKLPQGIDIYIHKKMLNALRSFLKKPYTASVFTLSTRVRFYGIAGKSGAPVSFETMRLRHSVPCYGYRFNIEGKIISYCTDTGLCASMKKLAKDADVFISECSMSPVEKSPTLFHITPEAAARLAASAGAKKLALCHFDPAKYPSFERRQDAEKCAKTIFENTIAANDGTVIEV